MGKILLRTLLREVLLNEVSIEELHRQFVGANKLSEEVFQEIVKASGNKSAYATWLASKVSTGVVMEEDIYKFEDFFKIFERYKRLYPKQDIHQYRSAKDVEDFKQKSIEIEDNMVKQGPEGEESPVNSKDLLNPAQIQSLKDVGITLLGVVGGYQCFEVPTSAKGSKEAYTRYRNLLGQCSGGKNSICTVASENYFNNYLNDGPYYVFFNLSDPQSPYQFHYESNQFMDRTDKSII